jgi:ParB-like chromosome segregation protein Spo0J
MGCSQSYQASRHPESNIYDLLENLSLSFNDYQITDENLKVKIEKTFLQIENIIQQLPTLSPFVAVEIRICLETLQKARPKLHRNMRTKFQRIIEISDISSSRSPRKVCADSAASTSPPTPPASAFRKHLEQIDQTTRTSSGSTRRGSSKNSTTDKSEEDQTIGIKLRSFYQNSLNQSQETLGEYGFFDDETPAI